MPLAKPLTTIFQCIEQNQEKFLNRLENAIAIQSVPSSEKYNSILDMIDWTNNLLKSLKVQTELRHIEDESYHGLSPLPPVLLGNLESGFCPNKATVLIYGHLDIKDARKSDGWMHEPFELFQEDSFLYGRGVSNKCSLLAWLNAVEAYQSTGIDLPVNIKFIFESLGTQSSHGLKNLLLSEKDNFLAHVDYICISKGSWLQPDVPCIINSLKGLCCFLLEVESAPKNLDVDICGGIVQEAMDDLLFVLRCLTDEKGNLNISPMQLEVAAISDEELQIYEKANFNLNNLLSSIGAHCLSHNGDQFEILKHRLGLPTITIHDIKSSCVEQNESEIPGSVTAKVSIRTVYSQTPEKVFQTIENYLQNAWSQYGSNNKMKITLERSYDGWHTDAMQDHFQVGVKAIQCVYEVDPCYLSNGYNIPAVNILTEIMKRDVILLSIGSGENYDVNENFESTNYYNAAKVFASYLYEMGELPRIQNESSSSFISCKSCPSAEACVCGRFGEKIKAASGDADKCVCTDMSCQPKHRADFNEHEKGKLCECSPTTPVETNNEVEPHRVRISEEVSPIESLMETKKEEGDLKNVVDISVEIVSIELDLETKNEETTITDAEEILEEVISAELPLEVENEEDNIVIEKQILEEVPPDELPPPSDLTNCKCPLTPAENFLKPPVGEIISLISTVSASSRDPLPIILEPEKPKKDIAPSLETLKCVCTPKPFRNFTRKKSITLKKRNELMLNMRSVGSEMSGISAGESDPDDKTTRMNILGCVCPEKSTESVFEELRQIERMMCPIKVSKQDKICTKGGKRRHHVIGPAAVEEDDEISIGPLSHCSCRSEESIVIPSCDCETKDGMPSIPTENIDHLPVNLEDEVD